MSNAKWLIVAFAAAAAVFLVASAVLPSNSFEEDLAFTTVKEQSLQFMEYERTIQLTADQEKVKKEALEAIPAPCCSDNSAYTCCCPCNLSRTTWGLAAYLISEKGADAAAVRNKAEQWIEYVNPDGFSGDVCYTGGCGRPFANNGCGGMNPNHLVL